jgi:hypothetical protein
MGDFNSEIGNNVIRGIKNRFNRQTINENGEELIHLYFQNKLLINNIFYPHKFEHKYIFGNTRSHKLIIDIITSKNIHSFIILVIRILGSASVGTNHGLMFDGYQKLSGERINFLLK